MEGIWDTKHSYLEITKEHLLQAHPTAFYNGQLIKDYDRLFKNKGSRKRATAYVILKTNGTGRIKVNNRDFTEYFEHEMLRFLCL